MSVCSPDFQEGVQGLTSESFRRPALIQPKVPKPPHRAAGAANRYKNTAAPPNGVAGLNACAIGYPHNPTLQTIMPNNLFVIKNGAGSIDYITVVATTPADVRVILEDLIG
jgi:hypothetical protein